MAAAQLDSAAVTTSYDKSSLDQTFRHLLITWQGVSSRSANEDDVYVRFNNDSGSSYDYTSLDVLNTTVAGTPAAGATILRVGACKAASGTSSKTGVGFVLVPSYTETTNHKAVIGGNFSIYGTSAAGIRVAVSGGLWRSTNAISRIQLGAANGNFTGRVSVYGLP